MLAVIRLEGADLAPAARSVLAAMRGRTGFVRGSLGRATDDPSRWVLVSEWAEIGDYRRALSSVDVRIAGAELFAVAADEPAAYEVLLDERAAGSGDDTTGQAPGSASSRSTPTSVAERA